MRRQFLKSVAALGISLTAFSAFAQAADEVTVGISISITGPGAALGVPEKNAIVLQPTEVNGTKLKLVVLDDASDPGTATTNARRMVSEDKVDILVGSAITPATIAMNNVAVESKVPHLALTPMPLPPDKTKYTVVLPQPVPLMAKGIIDNMKAKGIKNIGFIGFADSYGDLWQKEFAAQGPAAGITIIDEERFARADTSVTGQALKLVAAKPEAVLVAASGTAAALPNLALRERGYEGVIYQTHGAVTYDFIKIGGKAVEGTILPAGPPIVADLLPDSVANKKVSAAFVAAYEEKYGPKSRNQFAGHMNDVFAILARIVPAALKTAKPGTPEFREALRAALETEKEIIAAHGVYNFTPENRYGVDDRARVMLTVKDGNFTIIQ